MPRKTDDRPRLAQITKWCIVCREPFHPDYRNHRRAVYHDGHNGTCWRKMLDTERLDVVFHAFQRALIAQNFGCKYCGSNEVKLSPMLPDPTKAARSDTILPGDVVAACKDCRMSHYQQLALLD